jgi:GNAT superfamily N-acetyltransferase
VRHTAWHDARVTRTRSEYRLSELDADALASVSVAARNVGSGDRQQAAALLLDAYRGTIDDEGETDADALDAIDHYFEQILWKHSYVLVDGNVLQAMAFVVELDGQHYIDPVCTRATAKGTGLGTAMVVECLHSLAASGIRVVGATITDGNVPSERLFTRLGFQRVGAW